MHESIFYSMMTFANLDLQRLPIEEKMQTQAFTLSNELYTGWYCDNIIIIDGKCGGKNKVVYCNNYTTKHSNIPFLRYESSNGQT
jgi:hypothetical protein